MVAAQGGRRPSNHRSPKPSRQVGEVYKGPAPSDLAVLADPQSDADVKRVNETAPALLAFIMDDSEGREHDEHVRLPNPEGPKKRIEFRGGSTEKMTIEMVLLGPKYSTAIDLLSPRDAATASQWRANVSLSSGTESPLVPEKNELGTTVDAGGMRRSARVPKA